MAQPDRPLRADAARNRARVLEVAYETFAAEGLAVPIDEIARRAGVGAGTVYRHFPTKEDLFRAVIDERIRRIVDEGRALVGGRGAGRGAVRVSPLDGVAVGATDRGLADALAGSGSTSRLRCPTRRRPSSICSVSCCEAGAAGGHCATVIVDVRGRQGDPGRMPGDARRRQPEAADRLTEVVLDGLRARVSDLALAMVEC